MTPDQVPADLARIAHDAGRDYDRAVSRFDWDEYERVILAAVLPAHERHVRAQLAEQLREAADPDSNPAVDDYLAAALWDTCQRAESAPALIDDPRTIARAAYRWLADHLDKETP